MMYFVDLDVRKHWAFVKATAAPLLCEDTCGIVVLDDTGNIQAAAVFDSFTNTTCVVHLAILNPMVIRHGLLTKSAEYLFNTRCRLKIFGMTPSNNAKALKFNKHMGWREVYRIPDAYDVGVDYVLQEMTREECPWLLDQPKEVAYASR